MVDFKTGEMFINDDKAVEALQFYGDLITEVQSGAAGCDDLAIRGNCRRRPARPLCQVQMFAPYGTLINDPKISTTGGKWAWTTVPGPHNKEEGRTWIDGHSIGVPKYTRNKEWALEFVAMCVQPRMAEAGHDLRQCSAAALGAEDPDMIERIGWPPVAAQAIETGIPTPANPVWDTLEVQMRSAISQVQLGHKTAKVAIGRTGGRLAAQPSPRRDRPVIRRSSHSQPPGWRDLPSRARCATVKASKAVQNNQARSL